MAMMALMAGPPMNTCDMRGIQQGCGESKSLITKASITVDFALFLKKIGKNHMQWSQLK